VQTALEGPYPLLVKSALLQVSSAVHSYTALRTVDFIIAIYVIS
jgi:hypothetical protein